MSSPALQVAPDPREVLTRATVRAAELLGLRGSDLAQVIGVSGSTVSRYRRQAALIEPTSKAGELALLLVRLFRALEALVGSDGEQRKRWMHSHNHALDGVPARLVLDPAGLVRTLDYLDAMRSAA